MAARTPAGLEAAALQGRAMSRSVAMASVADPVFQSWSEVVVNQASADFPAPPYRVRESLLVDSVIPQDSDQAPTRTAQLNDLALGL